MQYLYYPGCSAHATGRAYEESIQAIAPLLDLELRELEDWNCCGATAYMSVNETLSFALTARNLALAQTEGLPVCTPCSACYTNLRKTNVYLEQYPELRQQVDDCLAEAGLHYRGGVATRHLLEVMVDDLGLESLRDRVKKPLQGLKVAPYYGCQILRPFAAEADPENPTMLERLLEAIGAAPTAMTLKTHCCGGSLMGTQNQTALRLCRNLLLSAKESGADCIAVTCPLCQFNLDGYQKRLNRIYGTSFQLPVLFFTQLVGMALGVAARPLGLQRGIVPIGQSLGKFLEGEPPEEVRA